MRLFHEKNCLDDVDIEHKRELRKERNRRYYQKHKADIEAQKIQSTLQKLQKLQEMPVKPKYQGY